MEPLGPEKGTSTLLKGEASLWEVVGVVSELHLMGCRSDHWLSGPSVALSNYTLAEQKRKSAFLNERIKLTLCFS